MIISPWHLAISLTPPLLEYWTTTLNLPGRMVLLIKSLQSIKVAARIVPISGYRNLEKHSFKVPNLLLFTSITL